MVVMRLMTSDLAMETADCGIFANGDSNRNTIDYHSATRIYDKSLCDRPHYVAAEAADSQGEKGYVGGALSAANHLQLCAAAAAAAAAAADGLTPVACGGAKQSQQEGLVQVARPRSKIAPNHVIAPVMDELTRTAHLEALQAVTMQSACSVTASKRLQSPDSKCTSLFEPPANERQCNNEAYPYSLLLSRSHSSSPVGAVCNSAPAARLAPMVPCTEHSVEAASDLQSTKEITMSCFSAAVPPLPLMDCSKNNNLPAKSAATKPVSFLPSTDDSLLPCAAVTGELKELPLGEGVAANILGTSVMVPHGWQRLHDAEDGIAYCSPTGQRLLSESDVRQYLTTDGTCKCGLPCPLLIPKVFSFDRAKLSVAWTVKGEVAAPGVKSPLVALDDTQQRSCFKSSQCKHASLGVVYEHRPLSLGIRPCQAKERKRASKPGSRTKSSSQTGGSQYGRTLVSELIAHRDSHLQTLSTHTDTCDTAGADVNLLSASGKETPGAHSKLDSYPISSSGAMPTNAQDTSGNGQQHFVSSGVMQRLPSMHDLAMFARGISLPSYMPPMVHSSAIQAALSVEAGNDTVPRPAPSVAQKRARVRSRHCSKPTVDTAADCTADFTADCTADPSHEHSAAAGCNIVMTCLQPRDSFTSESRSLSEESSGVLGALEADLIAPVSRTEGGMQVQCRAYSSLQTHYYPFLPPHALQSSPPYMQPMHHPRVFPPGHPRSGMHQYPTFSSTPSNGVTTPMGNHMHPGMFHQQRPYVNGHVAVPDGFFPNTGFSPTFAPAGTVVAMRNQAHCPSPMSASVASYMPPQQLPYTCSPSVEPFMPAQQQLQASRLHSPAVALQPSLGSDGTVSSQFVLPPHYQQGAFSYPDDPRACAHIAVRNSLALASEPSTSAAPFNVQCHLPAARTTVTRSAPANQIPQQYYGPPAQMMQQLHYPATSGFADVAVPPSYPHQESYFGPPSPQHLHTSLGYYGGQPVVPYGPLHPQLAHQYPMTYSYQPGYITSQTSRDLFCPPFSPPAGSTAVGTATVAQKRMPPAKSKRAKIVQSIERDKERLKTEDSSLPPLAATEIGSGDGDSLKRTLPQQLV